MKKTVGFTLIELMIVVAIIGILAAIAIPAYNGFILTTKKTKVNDHYNTAFREIKTEAKRDSTEVALSNPQGNFFRNISNNPLTSATTTQNIVDFLNGIHDGRLVPSFFAPTPVANVLMPAYVVVPAPGCALTPNQILAGQVGIYWNLARNNTGLLEVCLPAYGPPGNALVQATRNIALAVN